MTHTGWRKPTPGLGKAEQLAQAGEYLAVPKTRAFLAVKRVGAYIGLKAGDLMLLDTLAAFSQAQDWEAGRRPIVWASNERLMEQTGYSLSALKRHTRRLAEHGLIAFKDSPNGKRWGHRDGNGHIVEAYGFDLSPLSARATEYEDLHARLQTERELCKQLKRQITILRRTIRARINAASESVLKGPWQRLQSHFDTLLELLPKRMDTSERLQDVLVQFKNLMARVEDAFLVANDVPASVDNPRGIAPNSQSSTHKMTPTQAISEPHIQTTNQLESVKETDLQVDKSTDRPSKETNTKSTKSNVPNHCDIQTILTACPEFASWASNIGGPIKNWADLHRRVGQLAPMIGLTNDAWNKAQHQLGHHVASAAFALVFEKHSTGLVASPNGYLRGMVRKAGLGELNLDRSFYGRLNAPAA